MTYVIGYAAFVGDTLFMPTRARRALTFPAAMRVRFTDPSVASYRFPARPACFFATTTRRLGAANFAAKPRLQRSVHIRDGVSEEEFVRIRTARDAQLGMPKLILPSVQVNMRAGEFPPAEDDGQTYLKIPLNQL